MSLQLDQILVEQFLSDAHADFQSEGFLLRNACRTQTGVKGSVLHFPVFGQGMANQKAPQDDVIPMNISNRDVTLTIQDWYASEYADRSFKNKIEVNAVEEYTKLCSWALARRADQLAVDAAGAVTYSTTPTSSQGYQIAAGGAGFTYLKFKETFKALRQRSAAMGELFLVIDAEAEEDLLSETELTSSDFVNQKAIAGNGLNGMTLMGMNIIVLPNMEEGGLPSGKAYCWNKMAMGFGSSDMLGGDISWENVKTSYLINMWLEANAVAIDPKGFVEINFTV